MGITGLLPILKKASSKSHVRKFSGCTVAIDGYCWLHKGAFGCAVKLGMGEPTEAYITYCMKYIQILLDHNIKPVVVLDGRNLPSKEHTEKKRREKRQENRKLARQHMQQGNKKEAWECFTKCVDITPAMAREFIRTLRSRKIDYVVAPYEADAQLAYLARTGVVDVVITEDSDLVLFGCPKIFFKMNANGDGVLLDASKLPQCMGIAPKQFQFNRFRWMCIMSGCDYLPSLPGIGLGRAKKVFVDGKYEDITQMINCIPSVLEKVAIGDIPDEYIAGFIQADNTFLYQLVFDTKTRKVLPLTPYPDDIDPSDLKYAGSYEDTKLALGLALGNVDLHSLKSIDNFEPLKSGYNTSSIWSGSYVRPHPKRLESDKELAMQIAPASSQKKRPLGKHNKGIDSVVESVLDSNDLISMYADQSPCQSESEDEKPKWISTESPSTAKRRRLTDCKTENDDGSSTRRTRSKTGPTLFLKSPDNVKVIVKSKYFRSEEENLDNRLGLKRLTISVERLPPKSADDAKETALEEIAQQKLNIYSNSNSESHVEDTYDNDVDGDNLKPSSDPFPLSSQCSQLASGLEEFKMHAISKGKADPVEITLSDDDDANYHEHKGSQSSQGSISSGISQSPYFVTSKNVKPSFSSQKVMSGACRRQGLSRAVKKTSKQPSVRDMFAKLKSK